MDKEQRKSKPKVKTDKLLVRLIKKKNPKKPKTINIRNEKGSITIEPKDIKEIIRACYKQLYANMVNNR